MRRKIFFSRYGYTMVKIALNHIVSSIFGLMLLLPTFKNGTLSFLGSLTAVVFYLILLYSLMWEIGSKDAVRVEEPRPRPFNGFLVTVCGTSVAVLTTLAAFLLLFFTSGKEFSELLVDRVYAVLHGGNMFFVQTMYTGMIKLLNAKAYDASFLASLVPGIAVGSFAYWLGLKNHRILSLFGYRYDPEKEKIKKNY